MTFDPLILIDVQNIFYRAKPQTYPLKNISKFKLSLKKINDTFPSKFFKKKLNKLKLKDRMSFVPNEQVIEHKRYEMVKVVAN